MEVRPPINLPSTRVVSPWSVASSPRVGSASAAVKDSVQLQPPSAMPEASAAAPPSSPGKSKWKIFGAIGLAVAAAVGGGIAYTHYMAPSPPPIGQVIPPEPANANDQEILRQLDAGSQLFLKGKPIDAFGAVRLLDSGQSVDVGLTKLGYHGSSYQTDAQGKLTLDQIKDQQNKIVQPVMVKVHNVKELRHLNAAEKLTTVDTSASLTQAEKDALGALQQFEGGATTLHVTQESVITGGNRFRWGDDMPQPAIFSPGHHGSFRAEERLTAMNGTEQLLAGNPIVVRSASGLEQTVRTTGQLAALVRLEVPNPNATLPDPKTAAEQDLQEEILRELEAGNQLRAAASDQDVSRSQPLTAFQAETQLQANKPVIVQLGNGLSGSVSSMKDLALFNGQEGLTKIDGSSLLTPRDLQTATELRMYEGRTPAPAAPATPAPATPPPDPTQTATPPANPPPDPSQTATPPASVAGTSQPALWGTKISFWTKKEVASSEQLNVRDAMTRLNAGKDIAVQTTRGSIYLIHTLKELDQLAKLDPGNGPPPIIAPDPATPTPATPTPATPTPATPTPATPTPATPTPATPTPATPTPATPTPTN